MAEIPMINKFQKPKNTKKTFKRIVQYLLKYKAQLIFVIIMVILSSATSVAASYLLKPLINDIGGLVGTDPSNADMLPIIRLIMLMAGIYLVGVIAAYIYNYIMMRVANKVLNTLRRDLFNKVQDLPIKYFDTHTHGEIMSRFTNDVETFRQAISNGFVQFISSSVTVAGIFVLMIILSPILTVLVVLMLLVMLFLIKKVGGNSAKFFKKQQAAIGQVNGYIEEMIEGQKVVKVFCHEDAVKKSFAEKNENLRLAATEANTYANIIMPIMGNLSHVNYAATAAVGGI
ncbi:MAG: ABC transporter ATP-binding protein, partial [Clostridia bacterium]